MGSRRRQDGDLALVSVKDGLEKLRHRLEFEGVEQGAHLFPQGALAAFLVQNRLHPVGYLRKQLTSQLLHLIHQKSQHHQHSKHHGQVLHSVAKVVLEMIALILQGVERLILDFPVCPSSTHDRQGVQLDNGEIRDPTKVSRFALFGLPILDKVH